MLYGNTVFSARACAVLKEYKRNCIENEMHIIYVPALTTDVAFYVLKNPVCGIISEESSFATHGANILRCYFNNSRNEIAWVSGVKRSDLARMFEKKVYITSKGEIGIFSFSEHINYKENSHNESKVAFYKPLSKRSIVKYNISLNSYMICYWPHRSFDLLTFSIMKEGLSRNLSLFCVQDSSIICDDLGNIWFHNAPFVSELSELAKNIDTALPILEKQINMYERILVQLQDRVPFSELTNLIIDYFSIFLLFHDTYEDVLVDAELFLKNNLDQSIVYSLMNTLMSCKLDEWMLNDKILLEKRKSLLSTEPLVPLPPFSVHNDINYCISRFSNKIKNLGFEHFWYSHRKRIIFYIKFFVAKEWKFVLNKLLFTRFSNYVRNELPNFSFDELSSKSIADVQRMIIGEHNE